MLNLICYSIGANASRKGLSLLAAVFMATMLLVPATATSQSYVTNGIGEYKEFNEAVLLIKLELESPATQSVEAIAVDTNKKLSFRIMKDSTPRAWSKIWIQNLSINNSPDTLSAQTNDLIAMTQAFKGRLRTGDLVEFERIASDLTIMRINGNEIVDFETPEFFEFLLSAFIGSIPPSSELKSQLLAGGDDYYDKAIVFDSMGYTADRASQVAAWGGAAAAAAVATATPEPEPEVVEEVVEEATEEAAEEVAEAAAEVSEEATEEVVEEVAAVEEVVEEPEPVIEEIVEEEEAPIMITAESLLATQNYQRSVLRAVYQNIEYPSRALRRNWEDSLRVAIGINAQGYLVSAEISQNAERDIFDEAAIEAIENAAPFDALPETTLEVPMLLEIPISFKLQ